MSDKCTKPGNEDKTRYTTRTDAAFVLQNLRRTGVIKEDKGFVYRCGRHFHFTSQPVETNTQGKAKHGKAAGTLADDPRLHEKYRELRDNNA